MLIIPNVTLTHLNRDSRRWWLARSAWWQFCRIECTLPRMMLAGMFYPLVRLPSGTTNGGVSTTWWWLLMSLANPLTVRTELCAWVPLRPPRVPGRSPRVPDPSNWVNLRARLKRVH